MIQDRFAIRNPNVKSFEEQRLENEAKEWERLKDYAFATGDKIAYENMSKRLEEYYQKKGQSNDT